MSSAAAADASAPISTDGGASGVTDVSTESELSALVSSFSRVALNFWAPWAGPCAQMNGVFDALCATTDTTTVVGVRFARVPAEKLPAAAAKYRVSTVPTFVLLYEGRVVARIEGADPPRLSDRIAWLYKAPVDDLATAVLVETTKRDEIMLFMKGTPEEPRCGFSRQIVELLRKSGIVFGHFDILKDQVVREGLKKLHHWPTYPQLYARGRLVGGLDVVRQLVDTGELIAELARDEGDVGPDKASTDAKPSSTKTDDERDSGHFGAGESAASKDTGDARVTETPEELEARLRGLVSRSKIMLFMKGSPDAPECGFSRRIVALLRDQDVSFDSFDILADQAVRQGLKKLFDWPTFPQLYADGKLIGGLDIVQDLVQGGALCDELGL